MEPDINHIHYNKFKLIGRDYGPWVATRVPQTWARNVGAPRDVYNKLSPKQLTRDELKRLCSDPRVSSELVFLSTMAWGGMKIDHGRRSWLNESRIMPIVNRIRTGKETRRNCFSLFKQFREEVRGSGLGPAFFTKLIFFGHPAHSGYIMDQWTSIGINLLFNGLGHQVVHLNTGHYRGRRFDSVSDKNTCENYEIFCQKIEYLSRELETIPEEIELRLFSSGGRKPGTWRKYVLENRNLLKI